MKYEKEFVKALKIFCKEVESPKAFILDTHPYNKSNKVRTFLNKVGITLRVLEESTHNSDRAELYIGLNKTGVGKDMRETNYPMRLWFYACERRTENMSLAANFLFQLQGKNPYIATIGDMGDISNLYQFGWYEWVYLNQKTAAFPFQKELLDRCLGPTKNDGNAMCQWVLKKMDRWSGGEISES